MTDQQQSVLFVCLGNICRSPTAHGVFQALLEQRGLAQRIAVDSCGTGNWHVGEPPDRRATQEAATRGYDLSILRARQFQTEDFNRFNYIVAMDHQNLADLVAMCPANYSGYLGLFLPFGADSSISEVPDPYYGGEAGFAQVLDLVEAASAGLLEEILRADTA